MRIRYFTQTDTALLEFSSDDVAVTETREIGENVYLDLDQVGNPISMTVEHASQVAGFPQISVSEYRSPASHRAE
ncbi:MAG: DUF2283 domain-containing protein [Gemmatimonadaceae bacterium]|nr:DUF2283 domain-containing protein [Gemmatimonadaceae bacterium]